MFNTVEILASCHVRVDDGRSDVYWTRKTMGGSFQENEGLQSGGRCYKGSKQLAIPNVPSTPDFGALLVVGLKDNLNIRSLILVLQGPRKGGTPETTICRILMSVFGPVFQCSGIVSWQTTPSSV